MKTIQKTMIMAMTTVAILNACGDSDDEIQQGTRVSVDNLNGGGEALNVSPLSLSGVSSTSWTQHLGSSTHETVNASFNGGPDLVLSKAIGQGGATNEWMGLLSQGSHRLVYDASAPIIANGVIYHYDAEGVVHAITVRGQQLWQNSLVPPGASSGDGFGGGVVYGDGNLYVATGYGEVTALNASDGSRRWTYVQNAPIHKPPLLHNGMIVVVSEGSNAVAIHASSGEVAWRHFADPNRLPTRLNAGAPAARGDRVLISYASGTLSMLDINSGAVIWEKQAVSDFFTEDKSTSSDITGDPVYGASDIILGTPSGILALSSETGELLWKSNMGTKGPLIVSGNSIFGMSSSNSVFRLSRENGALAFRVGLPKYNNPDFHTGRINYGDIRLASGAIWIPSSKGHLLRLDAENGQIVNDFELAQGFAGTPVFGESLMVGIGNSGQVLAYQ